MSGAGIRNHELASEQRQANPARRHSLFPDLAFQIKHRDRGRRVQGGEIADVVLLPRPALERLRGDGKLVAGSETLLARSGIGVAVRKGAPKPDVSSPEALKRALLAAKSITYSNPVLGGASGTWTCFKGDTAGACGVPTAGAPGTCICGSRAETCGP